MTALPANSSFGANVATKGSLALFGAPDSDWAALRAGAVVVFERGASGWDEKDVLTPIVLIAGESYGLRAAPKQTSPSP